MLGIISLENISIALFVFIVCAAIANDVRALKIQNCYSISLAVLYPAYVLSAGCSIDWLGSLAVATIVFVVGVALFTFRLVGGGDVKLIAALSLWAGPGAVLPFLVVTTLVGGALAILMLTPTRYVLAAMLESAGADCLRDRLLGPSIPYAIPIAAGAAVAIAPVLLRAAT